MLRSQGMNLKSYLLKRRCRLTSPSSGQATSTSQLHHPKLAACHSRAALERCRQPYSHGPWPERVRSAAGSFPCLGGRSEAMVRSKWGSLLVANRLSRRRISVFLLLSRRKPEAHPCQPPGMVRQSASSSPATRRSPMLGSTTLGAEVTNVSGHCVWILLDDEELALPYSEFPWFKSATIQQILNVVRPTADHLFWPDLDIDLSVESIRHPERFPLRAKSTLQPAA